MHHVKEDMEPWHFTNYRALLDDCCLHRDIEPTNASRLLSPEEGWDNFNSHIVVGKRVFRMAMCMTASHTCSSKDRRSRPY